MTQTVTLKKEPRLKSLDIFRGITIAAMILVNTPGSGDHVYAPLEHSKWNGCTPTDLVFPSFLFMVGIAIVYALQKKRPEKNLHNKILLLAFRRMIMLIVIGWAIQLFYRWDFEHLRFPGVLQRIGVVYFITTVLYLKLSERWLNYIFVGCLVVYYIIMTFVPIPGGIAPNLNPSTNMAAYIDRFVFSVNHLNRLTKTWNAVGLLSTIPAISSTLFGINVGTWLRRSDINSEHKTIGLFLAGIAAILAGLTVNLFFPINKLLWSSSYVLYAAGICTLGLTITYWFVDVKQQWKALWPFLVFGTNAISAYVLSEILPGIIDFIKIRSGDHTVTGMKLVYYPSSAFLSPENASLFSAACFVLLCWLLMYPLYRKNILIKL